MIALQRVPISQLDEAVRLARIKDLETRTSEAFLEWNSLPTESIEKEYQYSYYISLKKQADTLRQLNSSTHQR